MTANLERRAPIERRISAIEASNLLRCQISWQIDALKRLRQRPSITPAARVFLDRAHENLEQAWMAEAEAATV